MCSSLKVQPQHFNQAAVWTFNGFIFHQDLAVGQMDVHLPPEYRHTEDLTWTCGLQGGRALWLQQNPNITAPPPPCLTADGGCLLCIPASMSTLKQIDRDIVILFCSFAELKRSSLSEGVFFSMSVRALRLLLFL